MFGLPPAHGRSLPSVHRNSSWLGPRLPRYRRFGTPAYPGNRTNQLHRFRGAYPGTSALRRWEALLRRATEGLRRLGPTPTAFLLRFGLRDRGRVAASGFFRRP